MSTALPKPPDEYVGPDRYIEWIEDYTGYKLTPEQREMTRAVTENKYVLIYGANGFGKTFWLVLFSLAFYYTNYPSSLLGTSGTYPKLKRTFCDDCQFVLQETKKKYGLPGEWKWSPTPHIDIDGESVWQFEIASPKDPQELEGVHNNYTFGFVEEADKPEIDEEVIDSMESLVTDDNDRLIVVANPPEDESNIVHQLDQGDKYHTLNFSSFDSHNVHIERGTRGGEMVPGLATLSKIKEDWKDYNNEEWPGFEEAKTAHLERDDLDTRWYRRRAGVMPPPGAGKVRPFYTDDVQVALDGNVAPQGNPGTPIGYGYDVARKGGDRNIVCKLYSDHAEFTRWRGVDHTENEEKVRGIVDKYGEAPLAVDAIGEGSGVADRLRTVYPDVHRFKAGSKPETDAGEDEYYNKWTEGLSALGDRLTSIAVVPGDTTVREQLFTAARVVEHEEKQRRAGDVVKATPKEKIKNRLDYSPDALDALVMAAWVADDLASDDGPSGTGVW